MKVKFAHKIRNHSLIDVLFTCKGNPRILLFMEPLWGIPFQLLAPFVTLYMFAQGVLDIEIGMILSITMVFQMIFAFFGGIITDKIGRKKATIMCDFFGWSVACAIWAISNNFWLFLIAGLVNSFEQIGQTAWQCLLVEDAKEKDMLGIYTWVHIAALVAIFFAPITGFLMEQHSLVPVVRGVYIFFSVNMVIKVLLTWRFCKETPQGKVRKKATKGVPVYTLLLEYKGLVPKLLRNIATLKVMAINVILHIVMMISNSFMSLYLAERLGVAERYLAFFPILNAGVMLVFMFFVQHKLAHLKDKIPMWLGLSLLIGGNIMFVLTPTSDNMVFIILYLLLIAVGNALVMPRRSAMLQVVIDAKERARIMGLFTALTIGFAAPFGIVAGTLSNVDRRLPFILITLLAVIACVIVGFIKETRPDEKI
ncbi:MAG: MFS transporter [Lachnospiraceae bacterium]|nr:MFS transporter [Lachnospiraceae bacterium]